MRPTLSTIVLTILALNTGWFVIYSSSLGLRGMMSDDPNAVSRVFFPGTVFANVALAMHMIAGAVLTIGAPLQALPIVRRRWPRLHRKVGYGLFAMAVITCFGGLIYIALNGTIGGAWMSLWFALYGVAILWSAASTVYFALDKDFARHAAWATRLIILAVGSWIFRMHYVIWFAITGGLGSDPALTGWFDRIQVFAFYVPYLLIAEIFLRRHAKRRA